MPVELELSISEGVDETGLPAEEKIQHWAQASYLDDNHAVVSMQVVGSDEMQQLNKDYRGKDRPTNVLSFPMEIPVDVGMNILGDLVLCSKVIEQEAREQDKTPEAHWAHMVIHGMLHLQGYDHIEDAEAEIMEAKEIEVMQGLGFDNPYI